MKRIYPLYLVLLIVFVVGCSSNEDSGTEKEPKSVKTGTNATEETEEPEHLLTNLSSPWSIQKSGNAFFISERTGTIVKWENSETDRQKINLSEPLANKAEAGFLGFTLAEDFEKSQQAYAYYTYESDGKPLNRVVLLELKNDEWHENKILLDKIPSGNYHHGGRIELGPDKLLYVTTGDAHEDEIAQDLNSLGGKILRLNPDGTIPSQNPIPDSYVYSYGHRNPQGLAWSETGQLYATEHGPTAHDEINRIEPGSNYGWPVIKGDEKNNEMKTAILHSGDDTWAPSGMDYDQGVIYIAALRGESVKAMNVETNKIENIVEGLGRIRDVFIDGEYMYFISNNTDGRGNAHEEDDRLYRKKIAEE